MRTDRIPAWFLSSVALLMVLAAKPAPAQEVRLINLTQPSEEKQLRRPTEPSPVSAARTGAEEVHNDCDAASETIGTVETRLLTYRAKDVPIIEVQIKNIGPDLLAFPVSTNVPDLQPEDPGKKFGYYVLVAEVWIKGDKWSASTGGTVKLYGNHEHNGSMVSLRPGEWLRIRANRRIYIPENVAKRISAGDHIKKANAKSSFYHEETLLTSTAAATVATQICLGDREGPDLPLQVAEQ